MVGCGSDGRNVDDEPAEGSTSSEPVEPVEPVELVALCGNGRREPGEACDLGIGNEVGVLCTASCTVPVCGDGELAPWEECDDGNTDAGDGCSPSCSIEGRPLWSSTVNGDVRDEVLWDLAAVPQGTVAVGRVHRSFFDTVPLVIAFGPTGEVRWRALVESGEGAGLARRVLAHGDEVLVAGSVVDEGDEPRAWVARFDAEGQVRASAVLDIPGARAVEAMALGRHGVLVLGDYAPSEDANVWVAEIDPLDGSVLWHAELDAQHEVSTLDDVVAVEEGWVVGGRTQGSKWIGRYDAAWQPIWERSWEHGYSALRIAVDAAADGRVYVAGGLTIADPMRSYDVQRWVVALEPDGAQAWEVIEPVLPGGTDHAADIAVDEQGGVWVVGRVKQQSLQVSAPWEVDAWIQRYDRDGSPTVGYTFDGRLHGSDAAQAVVVTGPDSIVVAGSSAVVFEGQNPWIARFGPGERVATPRPLRPPPVSRSNHVRASTVHRASLFIDFDGRDLHPGNWGTHSELPCLSEPIAFPGYLGSRADAESIVERVENLLAPYGIAVHWKRRPPAALPFTTVVVGGLPEQIGLDPRMKGFVCDTDCGDRWSRDLAFAFDAGPRTIAMNIAHEAAHTWGLDHESSGWTVMQPFVGPGNAWSTECVPVSEQTSASSCDETNRQFCPPGHQNSDAVLAATFGTSEPDDQPPTVEILAPAPGSVHPVGEPVVLEVRVDDDRGNPGFLVAVDTLQWSRVAVGDETRFELALPPGTFELRVEAVDHGGNETRRSVTIEVTP